MEKTINVYIEPDDLLRTLKYDEDLFVRLQPTKEAEPKSIFDLLGDEPELGTLKIDCALGWLVGTVRVVD